MGKGEGPSGKTNEVCVHATLCLPSVRTPAFNRIELVTFLVPAGPPAWHHCGARWFKQAGACSVPPSWGRQVRLYREWPRPKQPAQKTVALQQKFIAQLC